MQKESIHFLYKTIFSFKDIISNFENENLSIQIYRKNDDTNELIG